MMKTALLMFLVPSQQWQ